MILRVGGPQAGRLRRTAGSGAAALYPARTKRVLSDETCTL